MTTLVIATRNRHKLEEISSILSGLGACRGLNDFPGAPSVVEDANTFSGNATKKAMELARWLSTSVATGRLPPERALVLADDSGLEVDALQGAPGVHSARFAALDSPVGSGNSPDAANNAKLLCLLENVPLERRRARFRCVIALTPILTPAPQNASPACAADEFEYQTQLFEGACEGRIGFGPRGSQGFGYDPLFVPEGQTATFAELGEDVKNRISHRARALAKLKEYLARGGTDEARPKVIKL